MKVAGAARVKTLEAHYRGWQMAESRSVFRRVRIAVLLLILAGVLLWAGRDIQRRRERTTWQRRLEIAIVLLRHGDVSPSAIEGLRARVPELEARLTSELSRHRPGELRPFSFQVFGPIDVTESPPSPKSDALFHLAQHSFAAWRYARDADARAGVESRAFDSRIYLLLKPPQSARRLSVEGQSQQNGRIASVEVELDSSMVDFALFVATHELFHTLGASDKYDDSGHARAPEGLAAPGSTPLYPQPGAEVMARNVVVEPGRERPPESLSELYVGETTAREIGWLR